MGLHVTTCTIPPFHLTCQCHWPNLHGARRNVLPCFFSRSASVHPFGIAWRLAKTASAPTHMPRLPWRSGAQDTWQAHPCILPRIWPDLGSLGLTMGTIVTMPRRSAALHRCPLAIVPVAGCIMACAPHHHAIAMRRRGQHALCENAPDAAAAPGTSGPIPGCTPLAWKATSSPLSLTQWCTGFSWEC